MKDGVYSGGPIFDGTTLHDNWYVRVENGRIEALGPRTGGPTDIDVDLEGDILSPAYVDLQVNGGGGVMFNDDPTLATLEIIATAHQRLGTGHILPTLITDRPEITRAAISAVLNARSVHLPGIAGLHLEGPPLSPTRAGAHDPELIRRMNDDDLDELLTATKSLPILKVTLAPESATPEQVACLAGAGAIVALGHTDADFETCFQYFRAGARVTTHLFNAMSQLGSRAPGLVGATLASGSVSAGLIADGYHVHPQTMATAFAAKRRPGEIFLVSDAMATAGSDIAGFALGGRQITRQGGRLTLEDGTLAGADLDLTNAVRILISKVGLSPEDALRRATSLPARIAGIAAGVINVGDKAELIRISPDFQTCKPLV